jgi:hypothetical protein
MTEYMHYILGLREYVLWVIVCIMCNLLKGIFENPFKIRFFMSFKTRLKGISSPTCQSFKKGEG